MTEVSAASVEINDALFCQAHLKEVVSTLAIPLDRHDHTSRRASLTHPIVFLFN